MPNIEGLGDNPPKEDIADNAPTLRRGSKGLENILIETESTDYVGGSGSGPPQNLSAKDTVHSGASSSGGDGGRRGAPRAAATQAKADEWRGSNGPPRAPLPPSVTQAYVVHSESSDDAVAISSDDGGTSIKSTPRPAMSGAGEPQQGDGSGIYDPGPLPGDQTTEPGVSKPVLFDDHVSDTSWHAPRNL